MSFFKRSLTDLITSIRNHKADEAQFISRCIQEIKEELKSENKSVKACAIQKLSYLQMLGYDMRWAAFNVVEVMAHQKFSEKRIAYLAAAHSFDENTEVTMLATNLIKKDFAGKNMYEAGIAINCLANICTPDLARDLAPDIVSMLTSSRPYIRKRAVLVLYKIFLKFPEALRPSFNRLKEKLEDPDPSVVSAAVNVICELARKNPKNYLILAPTLFKLLTRSNNNWMLIKVIKLFAALTPLEPRLAKRLVEPLSNIINTTSAMSLLYECIQTCITGLSEFPDVLRLCLAKLRTFIEHPDQNLKYLGLCAMNSLMKVFPKGVSEYRDLIVNCLEDEDVTIRIRALDLLAAMVNKKNITVIVKKLIEHLNTAEGNYRDDLLEKIVNLCSQENYAYITDFEWYIATLVELTQVKGSKHGKLIRDQLLDVAVRVQVVRPFAVEQMIALLRDGRLLSDSVKENTMCEVLYAAAFIVGEYSTTLDEYLPALEALLQPRVSQLPSHIQAVCVHNVFKLLAKIMAYGKSPSQVSTEAAKPIAEPQKIAKLTAEALELATARLPLFTQSAHLEVQERACMLESLLRILKDERAAGSDVAAELLSLFDEPLNPVSKIAQRKVPIPAGLDLDAWINEPPKIDERERSAENVNELFAEWEREENKNFSTVDSEEMKRQAEARRKWRATNVHYLQELEEAEKSGSSDEEPPAKELTKDELGIKGSIFSPKKHKHRHAKHRDREGHTKKTYAVIVEEELPDGVSKDDITKELTKEQQKRDEKPDLGSIDLTNISPAETLPVPQHRVVPSAEPPKKVEPKGTSESEKKRTREHHRKHRHETKERERRQRGETATSPPPQSPPSVASEYLLGGPAPKRTANKTEPLISPKRSASPPRPLSPHGDTSPSSLHQQREYFQEIGSPNTEHRERRKKKSEAREHRHKERGDGEREHRPHKHRGEHKRERKPSDGDIQAINSENPPDNFEKQRVRTLCKDDVLEVTYSYKALPNEGPGKVLLMFLLKNKSKDKISSIEMDLAESATVKPLLKSATTKGRISLDISLPAGSSNLFRLAFAVQTWTLPQSLKGTLIYSHYNSVANKSAQFNLEFTLIIPSSAHIVPQSLSKENFVKLLTTTPNLALVTASINQTLPVAVGEIIGLLNVARVEETKDKASMYGRSVAGNHVAVLIKEEGNPNTLAVAVKSDDQALSESLIKEIKLYFTK
jgi:AP-3 complex subunit delta-1